MFRPLRPWAAGYPTNRGNKILTETHKRSGTKQIRIREQTCARYIRADVVAFDNVSTTLIYVDAYITKAINHQSSYGAVFGKPNVQSTTAGDVAAIQLDAQISRTAGGSWRCTILSVPINNELTIAGVIFGLFFLRFNIMTCIEVYDLSAKYCKEAEKR